MKVLVIPDCHLKPWMFAQANTIMKKGIADELPNSLEAEISGGNQLIMNYEQAQELFGIKFRRWLGIFNL